MESAKVSNSEPSISGEKFIERCQVLSNKNDNTDEAILALSALWSTFQSEHGIWDFEDKDKCLESLLICTSQLVLHLKYSKNTSDDCKQKLKETIVECGKTFSDCPHRKRLCDGISSIVENPWKAPKFNEVANSSSQKSNKNEAAKAALWDTEGWVLLETRMEYLVNYGTKFINRLSSVLHLLVEKGHEIFRQNSSLRLENEVKSFHPYRFPYQRYLEYLEVYALLYFIGKVATEVVDVCEERVLLDVISSLTEKVKNKESRRLFPKFTKLWNHKSDAVELVAKKATLKALKSENSIMLKEFFTKWMELPCSGNEEGIENQNLKSLVDEVYKNKNQISCENVYKLAQFTIDKFGITPFTKPKYVELFTVAMLKEISAIEEMKTTQQENTEAIRHLDRKLSLRYLDLTDFFKDHPKTAKDCLITAFCLNPCFQLYCLLFPDSLCEKENINNLGEEDDFIPDKYSALKEINFEQCDPPVEEELGLDSNVLGDLEIVIQNPRYKGLVGIESKDELRDICRSLLDFKSVTAIENKTLEHLDVDYDKYKDFKPQYDPDDDGIEKGYRPGEKRNVTRSFSRKLLSGSSLKLKARKFAMRFARNFQGNKIPARKGRPPKVKTNGDVSASSRMFERQIPNIALDCNPWFSATNLGGMYIEFYHNCFSRDELPSKEDRQGRNIRHEARLINNIQLIQPERNDNSEETAEGGFTDNNTDSDGRNGPNTQTTVTSEVANLELSSNNTITAGSVLGEASSRTEVVGFEGPVPQLPNGSFNVAENSLTFPLGQHNPYFVDPTYGPLSELLYAYQRQTCLGSNAPNDNQNLSHQKLSLKRKKQQVMKNGKRVKTSVENERMLNKSTRNTFRRSRKLSEDVVNAVEEPMTSDLIDSDGNEIKVFGKLPENKAESSTIEDNSSLSSPGAAPPTEENVINAPVSVASQEPPPKPEPVVEFAGAFQIMGSYSKGDKSENEGTHCGDMLANEPTGTTTCNSISTTEQPLKGNTTVTVTKVFNEQAEIAATVPPKNPVQDTTLNIMNVKQVELSVKPKVKVYTNKRRLVVKTRWNSSFSENTKLDEYKSAIPISVPINDDSIQPSCNPTPLSNINSTAAELQPNDHKMESSPSATLSSSNIHSGDVNVSSSCNDHEKLSSTVTPQVAEVVTSSTIEETVPNTCQISKERETKLENNAIEPTNSHVSFNQISSFDNTEHANITSLARSSLVNHHESVKMESTDIVNEAGLIENNFQTKQDLCEAPSTETITVPDAISKYNNKETTVEECINDVQQVSNQQKESEPHKSVGDKEQLEHGHIVSLSNNDDIMKLQQAVEVKSAPPSTTEWTNKTGENTSISATVQESKQCDAFRESSSTKSKGKVSLHEQFQSFSVSRIHSLLQKPKNKFIQSGGAKDATLYVSSSVSVSFCDNQLSNKEKVEPNSKFDKNAEQESSNAEDRSKIETLSEQNDDINQLEISMPNSNNNHENDANTSQLADKNCNDISTGTSDNNQNKLLEDGIPSHEGQKQITDTFTNLQTSDENKLGEIIPATEKVESTEEPAERLTEEETINLTPFNAESQENIIQASNEEILNNEKENCGKGSSNFPEIKSDTLILSSENADQFSKNVQDKSEVCIESTAEDLDAAKEALHDMLDTLDNKENVDSCEEEKHETNDQVSDGGNLKSCTVGTIENQSSQKDVMTVGDVDQNTCEVKDKEGDSVIASNENGSPCSNSGSITTDASTFTLQSSIIKEELQCPLPLVSSESQAEENSIEVIDLEDDDVDINSLSGEQDLDTNLQSEEPGSASINRNSKLREVTSSLLPHGIPSPDTKATSRCVTPVNILEEAINKRFKRKSKRPYDEDEDEQNIKISQSVVKHFEKHGGSSRSLLVCRVSVNVIPPHKLPEKARNQNPVKRSKRIRDKKLRMDEMIRILYADPKNHADDSSRTNSDQCGSDSDSDIQIIEQEDTNSNFPQLLNRQGAQSNQKCFELTENSTTASVHGTSVANTKLQTARRGRPFPLKRKFDNVGLETLDSSPAPMQYALSKQECGDSSSSLEMQPRKIKILENHEAVPTLKSNGFDSGSTTEVEEDDPNENEFNSTVLPHNVQFFTECEEVTSPGNPIELDGIDPLTLDDSVVPADINSCKDGIQIEPVISIDLETDDDESDDVNDYETKVNGRVCLRSPQIKKSSVDMFDVGIDVEGSYISSNEVTKETLQEDSDSDIEVIKEVKNVATRRGGPPKNLSSVHTSPFGKVMMTRSRQPIKSSSRSTRLTTDQSSNSPSSSLSPDENIIVPENIPDVIAGAQEADQVSLSPIQEFDSNVTFTPCLSLEDSLVNKRAETIDNNYILPDVADQNYLDDDNNITGPNETGGEVVQIISKDISTSHRAVEFSTSVAEKCHTSSNLSQYTAVLGESDLETQDSVQETIVASRENDIQKEFTPIQTVTYPDDTTVASPIPTNCEQNNQDGTTESYDVSQQPSTEKEINDDGVVVLEDDVQQPETHAVITVNTEESFDETIINCNDTSGNATFAPDDGVSSESNNDSIIGGKSEKGTSITTNFDMALSSTIDQNSDDTPMTNVSEGQNSGPTTTADNCVALVLEGEEDLHSDRGGGVVHSPISTEMFEERSVNIFTSVVDMNNTLEGNEIISNGRYEMEGESIDESGRKVNSLSESNSNEVEMCADEEIHQQERRTPESEEEVPVPLDSHALQSTTNYYIDLVVQENNDKVPTLAVIPTSGPENVQCPLNATHLVELEHGSERPMEEDQSEDNSLQNTRTNENSVDAEEMEYENSNSNLTFDANEFNIEESAMVHGTLITVTEQELKDIEFENNDCDESQDTFTTVPSPTNDIEEQQPMSPKIPILAPQTVTYENNSWQSDDEPPLLEKEEEIDL